MQTKPAQSEGRRAAAGRFPSQWWLVFGFWLLIAVASALEMSFLNSTQLVQALCFSLIHWLPWAVLTPAILWMVAACSPERMSWNRVVAFHLLACLVVVGALGVLGYFVGAPPYMRAAAEAAVWKPD